MRVNSLTQDVLTSETLSTMQSKSVLSNPVVKLLRAQMGLEPESLGVRVLSHCLADLARDFPGRSFAAIARSAQHDREVFAQVVGHFSVNESWLFRNPEQFAELRLFVQTRAQTRAAGRSWPLKVLSLPCACGEEPASIAITLQEAGLSASDFSIIAGDLDNHALAKARTGRLGLSAFRGAIPDPHWFVQHNQHYILLPSLLARIEYRQVNVLDPNLFQGELFDVIFCRNLLIYLHGEARAQLLQLLRRIAAPGALIFTGTAEPTLNFDAPPKAKVLAAKSQPNIAAVYPNGRAETLKAAPPAKAANDLLVPKPALVAPEPDTNAWKARLTKVEQCANAGDVQGACLRLDQLLDEAPTYAEAWYLRGVLASAQNDLACAEIALDRAAYLDPSHAPALRLRAELARRSGDNSHADRIRARLKRLEGTQ